LPPSFRRRFSFSLIFHYLAFRHYCHFFSISTLLLTFAIDYYIIADISMPPLIIIFAITPPIISRHFYVFASLMPPCHYAFFAISPLSPLLRRFRFSPDIFFISASIIDTLSASPLFFPPTAAIAAMLMPRHAMIIRQLISAGLFH
jgi:hypothetical protein